MKDNKIKFDLQMFAENPENDEQEEGLEEEQVEEGQEEQEEPEKKEEKKEPEKKYTDDDVDRIVSKKKREWKKELSEAEKLAEMTAEERANHENEKLKREIEELRKSQTLNEMGKTARSMLSENGINVGENLLSLLVQETAEDTKSNIEDFAVMFNEAVEKKVAERLKGKTPKTGKKASNRLTKESILSIQDRAERQRLIAENMDLFRN